MILLPRNTTAWKNGGTNTFRKAAAQVLKRKQRPGYGMNLQNPDEDICEIHIPDEGKIFVQRDQSGADARIVAWLCRNGNFRSLFENKLKPHIFVAAHIFKNEWRAEDQPVDFFTNIPIEFWTRQPQWPAFKKAITGNYIRYFVGKKSCHSFNYGMYEKTFITDVLKESEGKVALTFEQARKFRNMYIKELFPEIPEWWEETENIVKETHLLYNLFGFPREFFNVIFSDAINEYRAFIPQSTVAIITNQAQANLQEIIEDTPSKWKDVDILNNKHDSLLLQCEIGHEKEVDELLRGLMEVELITPRNEKFIMLTEGSVGYNWRKWHIEDNPNGMKEAA